MAKAEQGIYQGYSSPGPEDLTCIKTIENEWKRVKVDIRKLIEDTRKGTIDLSTMKKKQIKAIIDLKKHKLIRCVFALPNPSILHINKEHAGDLSFVFIRAAPKCYLQVKECIRNYSEQHRCSAYTTLGPYDFVVRMVALHSEEDNLKSLLRQAAPDIQEETEEAYGGIADNAYKISRVTEVRRYNTEENFSPNIKMKDLSDAKHRFLEEIHLGLMSPDILTKASNKKIYEELEKKHFVLGTRCAVNSPMLKEIVAFILVKGLNAEQVLAKLREQDEMEASSQKKSLDNVILLDNVVDVFSLSGWGTYNTLLTCEFPCEGFCAWLLYNRWMDVFYKSIESRCLTFPSDSTIEQHPDNMLGQKNQIAEKYYPSTNGLFLGNYIYFGKELTNQVFIKPQWLCLGSASIGGTGSGKSNTCRQLLYGIKESNKEITTKIKTLYLSFKGKGSIPQKVISELGGRKMSEKDFMNVKSLDVFSEPCFVQSTIGPQGKEVASKCFKLIQDIINQDDKNGKPPSLKRVVVMDEICNVLKEDAKLKNELKTLLNTCRASGIAIVIAHQELEASLDWLWQKCHNLFLHRGTYDETEISKISGVHGITQPVCNSLSGFKDGQMVFWTDAEKIPAIVVKPPLRE